MKTMYISLLSASVLLAACTSSSLTESEKALVPESTKPFSGQLHEVDKEHSVLAFEGKSSIVNHQGTFTVYEANVQLDAAEPANLEKAMIAVEIDLTSVETDSKELDGHLQKADFFDTVQFSKATFTSTSITKQAGNTYAVTGNLTIKGVTKPISFDAEITDEYLTAHYDVPRKEFGIGNDSYGDKLLAEVVPVDVKLVFVK